MSTVEILRNARELISDPARWTKHDYFSGGSFCMVGACAHAAGVPAIEGFNPELARFERTSPVLAALRSVTSPQVPYQFNDSHSHAEVLAVFDTAIAAEEAKVAA